MASQLELNRDGAVRLDRAALSILPALEAPMADIPRDRAGVRIHNNPAILAILASDSITTHIGPNFRPVRAILFDKSAEANWALGWHQDRTIAVKSRIEAEGFGPWSMKAGIQHVEPPFEMIERMKTFRIHLDDVPEVNAPLLIALGTHRLGKVAENMVPDVVASADVTACTAKRGDIWLYATPIIHASAAATTPTHRRVLQADFADFDLPGELEWKGI